MSTITKDSPALAQLLNAATALMLVRGFTATTVDEICERAKLTKGAFFHYFDSKEELGRALVEKWSRERKAAHSKLFGVHEDPLKRVLAYASGIARLAEEGSLMRGCLIGAFAQELQEIKAIRQACDEGFSVWVEQLAHEIALAKERHAPNAKVSAQELAEAFIAHIEGAILIAKASGSPAAIIRAAARFKRELETALKG